jgi:hypothetical protein
MARVNPSLSASRDINSSGPESVSSNSDEAAAASAAAKVTPGGKTVVRKITVAED